MCIAAGEGVGIVAEGVDIAADTVEVEVDIVEEGADIVVVGVGIAVVVVVVYIVAAVVVDIAVADSSLDLSEIRHCLNCPGRGSSCCHLKQAQRPAAMLWKTFLIGKIVRMIVFLPRICSW